MSICLSLELEGISAEATCSVLQTCIAKHESTLACSQMLAENNGVQQRRCLQGQYAIAHLCWRFIPAVRQAVQSCLVPNTMTHMLVCSQLHAAVTPHTLHLPLHTLHLTIILSLAKELYSPVKKPCVSSLAPKSSSARAPALPCASQEGDPEQALPQNLLQVAARRLALTPRGTSPGWKGEDHSRFSCGCQSLDTHRAQCSQCWIMPRKSPLCQTSCTHKSPHKCS